MCAGEVLLHSKLTRPKLGMQAVARFGLLERLRAGLEAKLTLVSAPAGFGKSTLAAQWLNACPQSVDTAWLALDENDNHPHQFWRYLIAAVQQSAPVANADFGADLLALLDSPHAAGLDKLSAAVARAFETIPRPLLFVLDDYHVIHSQTIHSAVNFLLTHLPPHIHLAIFTRADPPLPLHRLRAWDALLELRAGDLCFTQDELRTLFTRHLRRVLEEDLLDTIWSETEGWPVGAHLMALSMQAHSVDLRQYVETFSGANHYVLEYLLEEVLRTQPEPVAEFLLRTSILSRFNAALCDEMLAVADQDSAQDGAEPSSSSQQPAAVSSAILHHLETTNLFLVALDDQQHWYRYHHLFGEALSDQLERTHPGLSFNLHRRAGQWYAAHGFTYEAIDHALRAQDWTHAAELLAPLAYTATLRGELPILNQWLTRLPRSVICAHPRLALTFGWMLLFRGPLSELDEWIEMITTIATERNEETSFHSELFALSAMLAAYRRDVLRALEFCQQAEVIAPAEAPFVAAAIAFVRGEVLGLAGNAALTAPYFIETIGYCEQMGTPYLRLSPTFRLAHWYAMQGALGKAEQVFRQGLQFANDYGGEQWPVTADALIGLADIYLERNDLASAELYVTRGMVMARRRNVETQVSGLVIQSAIWFQRGNRAEAQTLLHLATDIATQYQNKRLLGWVAAAQARYDLATGALEGAEHWSKTHLGADNSGGYLPEYEELTQARLYLAQHRPRMALALLKQWEELTTTASRQRSLVEILTLQATAHCILREPKEATACLQRALQLAEVEGMRRIFLDERATIAPLLEQLAVSSAYAARLLADLPGALDAQGHQANNAEQESRMHESLTPRELDILRLVARGATNQQIGDQLVLTVGTVKGHVNHILGKLSARNRTQAAARGRELGII